MGPFKAFRKDERGATAVMFGLSIIPLLGLIGAALDYGRATAARTQMQKAVDAAALALVRDAGSLSDAQLQREGERVFRALFPARPDVSADPLVVRREGKTIRVAATGSVRAAVMPVLGQDRIPIGSEAQTTWSAKRIELALVLDNTGSMEDVVRGKRKIDELRKASLELLRTLRRAAPDDDAIKVSIVPFDTMVRLEPAAHRNAAWLDFSAADRATWTGYVWDREAPYDAAASAPNPGAQATLHPAQARAGTDLAAIMPLTSARRGYDDLVSRVASMRGAGCTNITIGAAWGLATLKNVSGMTGASASPDVERIVILLTDGDNTQNRRVDDCNGNGDRSLIDARTREACAAVRAGVHRFYTIRMISGNRRLLEDCASRDASGQPLFYDVQDADRVNGVFQEIVTAILGTRLTH